MEAVFWPSRALKSVFDSYWFLSRGDFDPCIRVTQSRRVERERGGGVFIYNYNVSLIWRQNFTKNIYRHERVKLIGITEIMQSLSRSQL